jgi:polysaccharide export outer membrane protein
MIKYAFEKLFILCVLVIFFSACGNEKKLVYFQKENNLQDSISIAEAYIPKIQAGDILSIYVSSITPEASIYFNPYSSGGGGSTSSGSGGSGNGNSSTGAGQSSVPGYLVDRSGKIEVPVIGVVKTGGLTTSQLADTLKVLLKPYLTNPIVSVRFLNFKILVLGEVARPDVYNIPNEMISLTDAIGMAGDLTVTGRRDSIQIIREVNGKKEFGYVNLGDRALFSSPYYYLHAHDIVYVKPSKYKAQRNDRFLTYIPVGISLLSLIILITRK